MILITLLSLILPIYSLCYRYEQGIYKEFNILVDPSFVCQNGAKFIGQIKFKQTFSLTPKILITNISYKYDKYAKYNFNILTTTKDDWTFSIECLSVKLYKYEFTWIAIIDDRVYVVNDYLTSNSLITDYQTPYYYFPQTNVELNLAIQQVSYVTSSIYVYVHLYQLQQDYTGNQFAIRVRQGDPGLGIQLVAGLSNCFSWYAGANTLNWESTKQIFVNDDPYIIPIHCQYYTVDMYNSDYRELQFNYDKLSNGSYALSVDGCNFYNNQDGGGAYTYYIISYDIGLITKQPHNFLKMRASKKQSRDYNIEIQFSYQQLNITGFAIYKDQQSATLSQVSSQKLSLIYQYKCQPGKKMVGNVLQCLKCQQFNYQFAQFCNKSFNLLTIYLDLYQYQETQCDLAFELNDQGFMIKETITTGGKSSITNTYTLVNFQILNQ